MTNVRNDNPAHRYELTVDGQTAFAAYQLNGDTITFTHTIVPPPLEGHGVGTKLVAAALDDARTRGLKVVPQCPFVAAYMERHPETSDLLARQAGSGASAG